MGEEEEEAEEGGRGGEREKDEKEDSSKWCYCNENKGAKSLLSLNGFI